MDESRFATKGGNMSCIFKDERREPKIPAIQRGDTNLQYYRQINHMSGSNLYEIMKSTYGGPIFLVIS